MAQIVGFVTAAERGDFDAYALTHGLDVTALANLLIARELHTRRLAILTAQFDPPRPLPNRAKIVAHTPEATKAGFTAHAKSLGLKPSRAAAVLFRAELEERWLEKYVLVNQIDST
jgi:hypothetical protein